MCPPVFTKKTRLHCQVWNICKGHDIRGDLETPGDITAGTNSTVGVDGSYGYTNTTMIQYSLSYVTHVRQQATAMHAPPAQLPHRCYYSSFTDCNIYNNTVRIIYLTVYMVHMSPNPDTIDFIITKLSDIFGEDSLDLF